jgi:hypothetical protein
MDKNIQTCNYNNNYKLRSNGPVLQIFTANILKFSNSFFG